MSFDPSDAQAWEDAGQDPLRYVALMAARNLMPQFRVYPDPADVGAPVEWEPVGVEEEKPRDESPWRHDAGRYNHQPWH